MAMTDDDIKAARAIIDKATPGPWACRMGDIIQLTDAGKGYPLDVYPDSDEIVNGKCNQCGEYSTLRDENAAFIAAARTGWPAALDEVERLRGGAEFVLLLDHYERDNLLWLLNQARSLGCDTGDWCGQIRFKLKPETGIGRPNQDTPITELCALGEGKP